MPAVQSGRVFYFEDSAVDEDLIAAAKALETAGTSLPWTAAGARPWPRLASALRAMAAGAATGGGASYGTRQPALNRNKATLADYAAAYGLLAEALDAVRWSATYRSRWWAGKVAFKPLLSVERYLRDAAYGLWAPAIRAASTPPLQAEPAPVPEPGDVAGMARWCRERAA